MSDSRPESQVPVGIPRFEPLSTWRELSPHTMRRRAAAFYEAIRRRRTVRAFASDPVPRAIVAHAILAAGTAPSGANMQPWHFAVIEDPAARRRLREEAEAEERAFYAGKAPPEWLEALAPLGIDADKPFLEIAPVVIGVFAERFGVTPSGANVMGLQASQFSLIPPFDSANPILVTTFTVTGTTAGVLSYSSATTAGSADLWMARGATPERPRARTRVAQGSPDVLGPPHRAASRGRSAGGPRDQLVATALPSIVGDVGGRSRATLVIVAYTLAVVASMPFAASGCCIRPCAPSLPLRLLTAL